jgi:metal-responsive CopG/Arc/MetJ family transcriptional regulator
MITIPEDLLSQVDVYTAKVGGKRSRVIRDALEWFLKYQREREFRALLKEGYEYSSKEPNVAEEALSAQISSLSDE